MWRLIIVQGPGGAKAGAMPAPDAEWHDETMDAIRQISAHDLRKLLESGDPIELVDVRTPEEQEIAHIRGARLLDKA